MAETIDPTKTTFSQAHGYEPLPQPMKLEEISKEARAKLWACLYSEAISGDGILTLLDYSWKSILMDLHVNFFHLPVDDFGDGIRSIREVYKPFILKLLPFNRLFDLLQEIMRHRSCPKSFIKDVARIFGECRLAYVVNTQKPVTILPAATEQEGQALHAAMKQLRADGLLAAETHLRKASECINRGAWSDSIRESIHAVESVARKLDPGASKTLGPALAALERQGSLHPALKQAFAKLYGYSSNEQGIRHALMVETESPAGMDEAVFMIGACAAFASFLSRKQPAGGT